MAYSLSGSGNAGSSGSSSLGLAATIVAGETVIVTVLSALTSTVPTVSDSGGVNVYVPCTNYSGSINPSGRLFICRNASALNGTMTVVGAGMTVIGYFSFTGLHNTAALSGSFVENLGNTGNATDGHTSGPLTPSAQPALVFGFVGNQNSSSSNVGTGFAALGSNPYSNAVSHGPGAEHKRVTSTAQTAATFTSTNQFESQVTFGVVVPEAGIPVWLGPDLTTTGWTSTAETLWDAIDETTANSADFIVSPDLDATVQPYKATITAKPAGNYDFSIRASLRAGTGKLRVRFFDASDVDVGVTADQTLTLTETTYAMSVTLTGTATKLQIETLSL